MMINKRTTTAGMVVLLITSLMIAGCSKDKYATKPSLRFKSSSSYDVPYGGLFTMRLEFTDAEGDLATDSGVVFYRTVLRCTDPVVTYKYTLPEIPATKDASGEIVIRYENGTANRSGEGYQTYAPTENCSAIRYDTTTFHFFIRDKAGHVSDTITNDRPIVIRRN